MTMPANATGISSACHGARLNSRASPTVTTTSSDRIVRRGMDRARRTW